MSNTNSGWVERAIGGDHGAFGHLVERHWNRLVRIARSVVGEGEAEDAVQEGLLASWRKLASLKDPAAFSTWLTRVVLHTCLRRSRRRGLWVSLDQAPEPKTVGDPDGPIDVRRLLASLAPRQRAVMHMTDIKVITDV